MRYVNFLAFSAGVLGEIQGLSETDLRARRHPGISSEGMLLVSQLLCVDSERLVTRLSTLFSTVCGDLEGGITGLSHHNMQRQWI